MFKKQNIVQMMRISDVFSKDSQVGFKYVRIWAHILHFFLNNAILYQCLKKMLNIVQTMPPTMDINHPYREQASENSKL